MNRVYFQQKMRELLSKLFLKKDKVKKENWSVTLTKIVESESNKDLQLPMLLIDNEIEWEFKVFPNLEELINTSIYSHWGGVTPNAPKLNATIIDCKGALYKIDNDCYNKELDIGYSYPKRVIGDIVISDLKKMIIKGCSEYIEVLEPDFKNYIISGMELINKSDSIKEIIYLMNKELNFDKLKNVG